VILVTGAAGKTGQAVMAALVRRGAKVRGLVRREEQVQAVLAAGARAWTVGDVQDSAVLAQAFSGVHAVYHICPNMHPDEVEIGSQVIAAARAAGVAHFVYHSVLHPQTASMPHHWNKLRVEEKLLRSGLPFTILQPTVYMQNVLGMWKEITTQGIYRTPYPIETRLSYVDLADVGAVAAAVLTAPEHLYATYPLVGVMEMSQEEVAAALTAHLGKPVAAAGLDLATWRARAEATRIDPYALDTLSQMFDYYGRYGLPGNSNVLRWLLGRAPRTFAEFFKDLPGS
jgi:uncharacterized protein YbjT (DUF2867 family)